MWTGLPGDRTTGHGLWIFYAAPPIASGIAVDHFIVFSWVWYAQPVSVSRHRSEVAHKNERLLLIVALAHK